MLLLIPLRTFDKRGTYVIHELFTIVYDNESMK